MRLLVRACAVVLVGGMAMCLVRYGPGFDTDDRDLTPGARAETLNARHERRLAEGQLVEFTRRFVSGAIHGDLGQSEALGVPVRELIAERGPASLGILLTGTALAWIVGLAWAAVLEIAQLPGISGASTLVNACLLCLPAAVIAALALNAGWPAEMVLALALIPKVFQVSRTLIAEALQNSEALAARARGLRTSRIFGWYVLPPIARPMLAWMAATVGLAIGAIVPVEVICDVPGLGQLAWKAALARDLPVLMVLILLVAIIVQLSSSASDLLRHALPGSSHGARL